MKKHSLVMIGLVSMTLSACSSGPHVDDWNRERYTEIPDSTPEVSICFDHGMHTKKEVYDLAREECGQRIKEVQNLVQTQFTLGVKNQTEAEGKVFQGPVQRQKQINAMVNSLKLIYVENDKWECPIVTPNRITFKCQYNPNARDSLNRKQIEVDETPSPDLPPELPEDLKPQ